MLDPSLQVNSLSHTSEPSSLSLKEFETSLLITHYLAIRAAAEGVPELTGIVARISTSLLRYTTVLPVDRAFYEAGIHCKVTSLVSGSHTQSLHCIVATGCQLGEQGLRLSQQIPGLE